MDDDDWFDKHITRLEDENADLRAGIMECEIAKLSLSPGDVVVLTVPGFIEDAAVERLKTYCEQNLSDVKVFIFGDGMTASVVKDIPHDVARLAAESSRLRAKLRECEDARAEMAVIMKRKLTP